MPLCLRAVTLLEGLFDRTVEVLGKVAAEETVVVAAVWSPEWLLRTNATTNAGASTAIKPSAIELRDSLICTIPSFLGNGRLMSRWLEP
jgi:hypothetical protein